jgi:hypothetical protein
VGIAAQLELKGRAGDKGRMLLGKGLRKSRTAAGKYDELPLNGQGPRWAPFVSKREASSSGTGLTSWLCI